MARVAGEQTKPKSSPYAPWPRSFKLAEGDAALLFHANGAISAQIPKAKAYAPESPGMLACVCMIVTSEKMKSWRARFIERQFSRAKRVDGS